MEKMKFKAGELICREGSPGSEMYVILSGKVRIFKIINEEKIELALMGSGDFADNVISKIEGARRSLEIMYSMK